MLTQGLAPRLKSGAERAESQAVAAAAKWGGHKQAGGLCWATYKVRRGAALHERCGATGR